MSEIEKHIEAVQKAYATSNDVFAYLTLIKSLLFDLVTPVCSYTGTRCQFTEEELIEGAAIFARGLWRVSKHAEITLIINSLLALASTHIAMLPESQDEEYVTKLLKLVNDLRNAKGN